VAVAEVIKVAESLLALNQEDAALSVCAEAAAGNPAETGALIDALRDIGRPVDAYRLLESLGTRTVEPAAEVIASLRTASRADDADRVLQAFLRQGLEAVCDLLTKLGQLGVSEDGSRLAALIDAGTPDPLSGLASALIARQAYTVADHLLARAAQGSELYCCELIDRTLRLPASGPRPPATGSDFPAPERRISAGQQPRPRSARSAPDPDLFPLHWRAHHDHGDLLDCLRGLRSKHLGVAARELLGYAARGPEAEVVQFARDLDWTDGPGTSWQSRVYWPGTIEAAALIAATADQRPSEAGVILRALIDQPQDVVAIGRRQLAVTELLSAIAAYPDDVIIAVATGLNAALPSLQAIFVRTIKEILPEILAGNACVDNPEVRALYSELLTIAGRTLPPVDFYHLYVDLRDRALSGEADFLLKEAAANPEVTEIITKIKNYGLRREARQLSLAARQKNG